MRQTVGYDRKGVGYGAVLRFDWAPQLGFVEKIERIGYENMNI